MALYNNPAFAQGLAGLVGSFIGNPDAEAKSLLAASEAKLNNQTAQFRDAIGETGMSGDLAGMMIRALQAGPDYSRYAPGIGDKAVDFLRAGFGVPGMMPTMAPRMAPRPPAGPAPAPAPVPAAAPAPAVDEAATLNKAREAARVAPERLPEIRQYLVGLGIDPAKL